MDVDVDVDVDELVVVDDRGCFSEEKEMISSSLSPSLTLSLTSLQNRVKLGRGLAAGRELELERENRL